MALDLRKADDQVRAAVPSISRVVPVGEAFNCAIARKIADPNPYDGLTPGQIDLWASDHYHASNEGYYLEALTIFTAVTHTDPRKLERNEAAARDLGIGPPLAAKLQDIAFHVGMIGRCAPLVTDAPAAEPATRSCRPVKPSPRSRRRERDSPPWWCTQGLTRPTSLTGPPRLP